MTTNGEREHERERAPVRAADRMPPCNLRAEQGVLGACLLDPALVDDVSLVVQPDDFYRPAHVTLFGAMLAVRDAGVQPDLVAVAEHLERSGRFDSIGGDEMLAELVDSVPHAADATYHAKIVAEKATARRLIEISNETMRECYANELDASALLERAESRLFALAERGRVAQIRPIRDVAAAVWRRLTCRRQGEYPGVATGLYDLDGTIDGMKPGAMVLIAARPSIGKAQPLSAKVLTPDGFVAMQDLHVGDMVVGSDGLPCRVIGVYPQGELPVYRVTMTDGSWTECCDEHLWFTQTHSERRRDIPGSVKTLAEIRRSLKRTDRDDTPNHAVPIVAPVRFRPREPLRLHPYLLGLLLGDGLLSRNTIGFSKPEPDLQRRLAKLLPEGDVLIVGQDEKDCRIRKAARGPEVSATRRALESYGLFGLKSAHKFIPPDYLFADPASRLDLLRGLFDTDGHVAGKGRVVEFSTSSRRLADDVTFLVRSLGGMVSVTSRIPAYTHGGTRREGQRSYRLFARFSSGVPVPVASEKHLSKWKTGPHRICARKIASVEHAGSVPCQCIQVSASDQLYVTDDFIVTHNTALGLTIAEHAVLEAAVPTLFVSLEMDAESLGERLLVMGARVDGHVLRTGRCLAPEKEKDLSRAQARLESCQRLWIDDSPVRTVSEIHAAARLMRRRHGLGLLIVDYLQLIEPPAEVQRRATRQEQVARISARLKQIARDLAIPIVVLCQLNRAPEARADKRPQLGDLRESGALEQDADVVLLLHRPEFYDEHDRPGEADLIVAKQRNGRTGVVRLAYRKEMARFESASDRTADFL